MSNREPKKKLVGPWRNLQVVIWLLGIYILASRDWWWPGILVVVAISAIYEGLLQRFAPDAYEEEATIDPASPAPIATPINPPVAAYSAPIQEHRLELLPQFCPSCNGPIRGHEVKWTGPQSANCPYCGTNLPMSKA
jgi:hypothetical protein